MFSDQKRSLQAFRRMQGWFVAHPELTAPQQASRPPLASSSEKTAPTTLAMIPGISPDGVAQQLAAFNIVVDRITTAASEQERHDRDARDAGQDIARAKRELVYRHIRDIALIAKTAIPEVVRMTAALKRPRKTDAEAVISAAEAMAKAAGQHKAELVQRGLSADFIEQLQAAASEFRRAIDARGGAIHRRVESGSVLETAVRRGHVLSDAISVLVERRFAGNENVLAEWRQLRRVVKSSTRVQVDSTSESSTNVTLRTSEASAQVAKVAAA